MTNPSPGFMEDYGEKVSGVTQAFSPEEYPRTAKKFHWYFEEHLPRGKSARILDVGCGAGHFLYYLMQEGYTNIEGLDLSEASLALCRRHVWPNVHRADAAEWLKDKKGAYDAVVCNHVIEHLEDKNLFPFLESLAEAVASGGRLLLTTPNACTPWAGYNRFGDLTHVRLFTANSLAQLLASFGLEARFYSEGPAPYDFMSASRWLLWKAHEAALKLSFAVDLGGVRGNQTTPLIVSQNLLAVCAKKR
ncbi:MAG: class I SAM-dependent methyltransferase [Elusimicrobiota bacterium]